MAVIPGEGTVLKLGASAVPTVVTQATSITLGAIELASIDTFSIDSTAKTSRPSRLPDYGSLSLEFNYDPDLAGSVLLKSSATSGATVYFDIAFQASGDSVTGNGYVTSFEVSGMEVDSNLTLSVEIKLNTVAFVSA